MDPGVGSPRRVNTDRLLQDPGEGLFDQGLYRQAIGLNLPSGIGGTVIFDGHQYGSHNSSQPAIQ
jgi:hypothetical protein